MPKKHVLCTLTLRWGLNVGINIGNAYQFNWNPVWLNLRAKYKLTICSKQCGCRLFFFFFHFPVWGCFVMQGPTEGQFSFCSDVRLWNQVLPIYVVFTGCRPSRIKNLWRCNQRKQIGEPLTNIRMDFTAISHFLWHLGNRKRGVASCTERSIIHPRHPLSSETHIKSPQIHLLCGLSHSIRCWKVLRTSFIHWLPRLRLS